MFRHHRAPVACKLCKEKPVMLPVKLLWQSVPISACHYKANIPYYCYLPCDQQHHLQIQHSSGATSGPAYSVLLPLVLLQHLLQGEYHTADSQQSVCLSFTGLKSCVWLLAALNDSTLCLVNVDDGIQWKYLEGSKTVTVIFRFQWPENVICASAGVGGCAS